MLYLGIDPGLNGAVGIIDHNGFVAVHDMPTFMQQNGKRMVDPTGVHELIRMIRRQDDCIVAMEAVHAMPGQGVTGMFNMGMGFGIIRGVLACHSLVPIMVRPQAWKKPHGLIGQNKKASIALARELFPSAIPYLERAKDDGRAESLLIGHWLYGKQ